jgi:hypothetical protein
MKILLSLFAIVFLSTLPARAGAPTKQDQAATLHREQVSDLIARVAYAKANANPVVYGKDNGKLGCIVYTVKHGAGGDASPGYSLIIAVDQGFAPADDIALVCDTVEIVPDHLVKCSGHIVYSQSGWITIGGDKMTVEFGIGKKDRAFKATGPAKTDPM